MDTSTLIDLAIRLQAIAQTGRTYCDDPFCEERYHELNSIAQQILTESSTLSAHEVMQLFAKEAHYPTPKLDVRGGVFQEGQILLVQEQDDKGWSLPGGWADLNNSPSESVMREIQEESGYHTTVRKLVALLDKRKHEHPPQIPHAFKCFFLCDITKYTKTESIEIDNTGFFNKDTLPTLSEHRVTTKQIHMMFEHHLNPNLPTVFD